MTLCCLYLRETRFGPTPAEQRAVILAAAAERGWQIGPEFHDTESPTGRPGPAWRDLLMALRAKSVPILAAESVERMFRSIAATRQLLDFARHGEATLHFAREGVTATNSGALSEAMRLIGNVQHWQFSERSRRVLNSRRDRGLSVGRPRGTDAMMDAEIERLLEEGLPMAQIAARCGVGTKIVRLRAAAWKQGLHTQQGRRT